MTPEHPYLVGGWPELLAAHRAREAESPSRNRLPPLAVSVPRLVGEIRFVRTKDQAEEAVRMLKSVPLSAMAIDSEYRYSRPPVDLGKGRKWYDVRSIDPLLVSIAACVGAGEDSGSIARFVFDVRNPEVVESLGAILEIPVVVAFHNAKAELFTFWALGISPNIYQLYDTMIAAASIHLGLHHRRAVPVGPSGGSDSIAWDAESRAKRARIRSLVGQCDLYGIRHPFDSDKESLQRQFLTMSPGAQFSQAQIEYAAADAEVTLRLYAAQQATIFERSLNTHLQRVEFPFVEVNARMEWDGVHVSDADLQGLQKACWSVVKKTEAELASYELRNPGSAAELLAVVDRLGLGRHFRRRTKGGGVSTKDDVLEKLENVHPLIGLVRRYRKYRRLLSEPWIYGSMTGADGRLHPNHVQLGADTGRNSCSSPNIAGIGRDLRPIVSAPEGRAIIELDYAQVEVGVAAAVHNDPSMIDAYNSGDVYAAMAQLFKRDELTPEERAMDSVRFKSANEKTKKFRNDIKTFVLAVLYNSQPPAIAVQLGISEAEARVERERFLDTFPVVKRGLAEDSAYGTARGYAYAVSGLRRMVPGGDISRSWRNNLLRNTPIQGAAAIVFKTAMVDLYREFRGQDVQLILPVHDAVVIECSTEEVEDVAQRARFIMEHALHGLFPSLRGKVDVNKEVPRCWNKDGHSDSLEKLIDSAR